MKSDILEATPEELKEEKKRVERIKEAEDLIGIKSTNPFGTTDLAIFEEKLQEMDSRKMAVLAEKVGVNKNLPTYRLYNSLRSAFIAKYGIRSQIDPDSLSIGNGEIKRYDASNKDILEADRMMRDGI